MSWGNPQNFQEQVLTGLLKPAAAAFGFGSYLRLKSYNTGLLKQHHFGVPVISIGNITCGGTGKTPVTVDLASRLIAQGRKVAILSRGYGRISREEVVVVSDGEQIYGSAADSGDEPYMMAQALPQAVVLVSAKRAAIAEMAVRLYNCDVIILDDGFQHIAVARNHDLVLLDYHDDPLKDSLLPAGRLREPICAINRANWIAITKLPENINPERLQHFKSIIERQAPLAQISYCKFISKQVRVLDGSRRTLGSRDISGMKVVAFSGIARPESFHSRLSESGAQVVRARSFPDHHWYTTGDIELIKEDFNSVKAELLITTEKDAVRLPAELTANFPVCVLELQTQWLGAVPIVEQLVEATTRALLAKSTPKPDNLVKHQHSSP